MKNYFNIYLVNVLISLSVCLEGGRDMRVGEFPFLVEIEKNGDIHCMGIIVDKLQVIFPSGCIKDPAFSIGYSSVYVVPQVNESPPKRYKGWFVVVGGYESYYTPFTGEFEIVRLEHPGLILARRKEDVHLPTRAPISRSNSFVPSDVIVVGINRRVGMMSMLSEKECRGRTSTLRHPIGFWMMSTRLLISDKLVCAGLSKFNGTIQDIPPGQACKEDKGAAVIQNASYDVYSTSFTGYFDVVRLEHPGIVLAQKYGNISLPTSATLNRRTSLRDSHVIIVGLNRRVCTMRIVGENGFHRRISMNPLRASLMRTKYIQQDRLFCAVMGNSTRSIENVPRGKACSQDVGAPVIQNGTVVGMVIHASCSVKVKWPATYFVRLTYSDIPKEKVSEFP